MNLILASSGGFLAGGILVTIFLLFILFIVPCIICVEVFAEDNVFITFAIASCTTTSRYFTLFFCASHDRRESCNEKGCYLWLLIYFFHLDSYYCMD